MTPEQMHEAANRLRAWGAGAAEVVRAARMLDRLAVNPERDPVDAFLAPPRRWAVTEQDAEGRIVAVEELPPGK